MRRTALGEEIASKVIAPAEQRHLKLEPGLALVRAEDDVIRRAVLEMIARDDGEILGELAEPETGRVEEMRAEIRQHAGALIAPRRVADQPCSAVAVEHAAAVEAAKLSRGDELAHAHEMRLKAMVVGGVADCAGALGERFERRNLCIFLGPQRLLDQHMLTVAEQIRQQLELRLVWATHQGTIIAGQRHFGYRTIRSIL